jgi:uncharacterized protein (TIGR00369 family)
MNNPDAATRRLPYHGPCFVCGPDNENGIGLDWFVTGEQVHTELVFTESQQGPRNHAHGGAAAAVLDEAMGASVWTAGHKALAANLNVNFKRPVPLNATVTVDARVTEVKGRKAYASAQLKQGETVLVEATGLFLAVPDFFEDDTEGWGPGKAAPTT